MKVKSIMPVSYFFRNQHQVFQEPEQSFYQHMLILSNATDKGL